MLPGGRVEPQPFLLAVKPPFTFGIERSLRTHQDVFAPGLGNIPAFFLAFKGQRFTSHIEAGDPCGPADPLGSARAPEVSAFPICFRTGDCRISQRGWCPRFRFRPLRMHERFPGIRPARLVEHPVPGKQLVLVLKTPVHWSVIETAITFHPIGEKIGAGQDHFLVFIGPKDNWLARQPRRGRPERFPISARTNLADAACIQDFCGSL